MFCLLALAIAAEATAQTVPNRTKTTNSATRRSAQKARATARKPAAKPAAAMGGRTDTAPAGDGAAGSPKSADGQSQSIYAAPGMPIIVNPKKIQGYDGPAPTKAPANTTLTPR